MTALFDSTLATETKKMVSEKNLKQHKKWREFRQEVWRVHHEGQPLPEDEELLEESGGVIVAGADTINTICPITRQTLVKPVRNTHCGHVYSYDAIMDHITKGGGGCPVAGCSKNVTKKSVQPDLELEKALAKLKKQKPAGASRTADVDLEL
jgi:SUMO ligase MMS21 Smc5/6 complex component